jgi:hypothetical protein
MQMKENAARPRKGDGGGLTVLTTEVIANENCKFAYIADRGLEHSSDSATIKLTSTAERFARCCCHGVGKRAGE